MKIVAEHQQIATNGIRLHVVAAGPADGPLVILLHGFPAFWYSWYQQIPVLAAAGYRVLVPDQRGYNLSDKPRGLAAYRGNTLADDIVGLITAAGRDQACIVGHDWGAGVAWGLALTHPARVARLVILNGPHPAVMQHQLRTNPAQLRKSWYIFAFQLPWLPEWAIRRDHWALGVRGLRDTSRPGTFSDQDLARYRRAWSRPGAMTAMIHWYRAVVQRPPALPADQHVAMPTLIIWGAQDPFLGREIATDSLAWCADGRLELIEDATHWVQNEEPARVSRLILDFLAADRAAASVPPRQQPAR
ncbi:MAG TPA: alpha/beta hydrolase [Chloroflexia bacterium]|nr:alpha/beta hydrolase [Chloroflexia bacterium]